MAASFSCRATLGVLFSLAALWVATPAGSAAVGLVRDDGRSGATGYTDGAVAGGRPAFEQLRSNGRDVCRIELRGDDREIVALVDGRVAERWSRAALGLVRPSVQLNAEASGIHDALHARLVTVRALVAGSPVAPACAFSTRGIRASRGAAGEFRFAGHWNETAPVSFLDLATGRH